MTTICFDFGNTRLKAAVFNKDVLVEELILTDDKEETIQLLLQNHRPGKTILYLRFFIFYEIY